MQRDNKQQQPDAKAVDEKLKKLGIEGETPEERVEEFKRQYWTDATLGIGYLKPLSGSQPDNAALKALVEKVQAQKPPVTDLTKLSDDEKAAILSAINARKEGKKFEQLNEAAIISDKRTHWIDGKLTPSVEDRVNAVAAAAKAMKSLDRGIERENHVIAEKIDGKRVRDDKVGRTEMEYLTDTVRGHGIGEKERQKREARRAELRNEFDLNRDGELSLTEIKQAAKAAGVAIDASALQSVLETGQLPRPSAQQQKAPPAVAI